MRFLSAALLLVSLPALAATTVVLERGKPVEVDYGDGRRAALLVSRKPAQSFPVSFQVAENTCAQASATGSGAAHFGVKAVRFDLRWLRHPNAEKLGKPVILKPKQAMGFQFELSMIPTILTAASRVTMPVAAADLPTNFWKSDDFGWLPAGERSGPDRAFFVRWDAEFMAQNPETGLMENRTQNLASGVELRRDGDGTMKVASVRRYALSTTAFLQGDVWSLVLREGDGYCQISLKPDLAAFQRAVVAYFTEWSLGYVPYRYEEDELSDRKNQNFFFVNYVPAVGAIDVE